MIGKEYWNKGFATEGAIACIDEKSIILKILLIYFQLAAVIYCELICTVSEQEAMEC